MKHQWYGDNRDLVKWGTLITLCRCYEVKRILQVAMLTPDKNREPLRCNGNSDHTIPDEVWQHFRDLADVKRLGDKCRISIAVFDQQFSQKVRQDYFEGLAETVRQQKDPIIIFLDPDTGICPSRPKKEHISCEELNHVWQSIKPFDFLALYQHRWRNKDWQDLAKKRFLDSCAITSADVFSSQIAHDVTFLVARKN